MAQAQLGVLLFTKIKDKDMTWDNTIGYKNEGLWILGRSDVPIYLLRNKSDYILVEGGVSALYPKILNQLREIIIDLKAIKYWVITHSHFDHCGLLPILSQHLPEVKIFASKKAIKTFYNPKAITYIQQFNSKTLSESQDFSVDFTPNNLPKICSLEHGDTIDLEGLSLRVFETPGHSDCSISLFDSLNGRLFVSDALGEIRSNDTWFPLCFENIDEYLNSIDLISEIPFRDLALGHHGMITGPDAKGSPSNAKEGYKNFVQFLKRNISQNKSVEEICELLLLGYENISEGFLPSDLYILSMKKLISLVKNRHNLEVDYAI